MRTSEWIQIGFAVVLAVAAWIQPLPANRRIVVAQLAAFAIVAVFLARLSAHVLSSRQVSILRDWLPVVLMLVPYWQTGRFFLGPNEKIQAQLENIDRRLLNLLPRAIQNFVHHAHPSTEWAYMFCYPMVPLGLGALYIAGLRQYAGTFWFIVLVSTYLCYAITLFVPALPPRSLKGKHPAIAAPNYSGRAINLWVLKRGSIQAISFPSAHVASAMAISLVLLHYLPLAGMGFLFLTFWIAVGAVVGGYHYAIDVLLGAVLTLLVVAAWLGHLIPSTLFTTPAIVFTATF